MKKLRNHYIGVDQGEHVLFSDFENDGPMWSGKGPRLARNHVRFSERFKSAPIVHVGLTMWDMDSEPNARMDIKAERVNEQGFDIVFRTWGDTRVARVRAQWTALGELRDSDEWDLY
ncbi:MAG: H-type lectin domain-containing protein [Pseudomonadota bacterium]